MDTATLLSRGLPKWPQMLTTGKPLTADQAREIIRRTDRFFVLGYGGNDRSFCRKVKERLGVPLDNFDYPVGEDRAGSSGDYWRIRDEWQARWGCIDTAYVYNSWIACAFVGGPHGWCHPDGGIGYVDNVGKWPDVEDVAKDWRLLAEAFPFIEVGVTLMDGENCEEDAHSIVSLRISDGAVEIVDPTIIDVHADHPPATRRPGIKGDGDMVDIFKPGGECGIPLEWIDEWERFARSSP